jgi:putative transposase
MGRGGVGRAYTREEKQRALELTRTLGAGAASRQLGIPKGTLSFWKHVADKTAGRPQVERDRARTVAGAEAEASRTSAAVAVGRTAGDGNARLTSGGEALAHVVARGDLDPVGVATGGRGPAESTAPGEGPRPEQASRVARRYTPSQRAEVLEYAAGHGLTAAARRFGCCRWSIRDWQRKVKRHLAGKATTSPVVGSDESPAVERDRRILAVWRAHPGLGPTQVRNQLRRAGLKVAVSTVRTVLEDNGYVAPRVVRHEPHDRTYEAVRPNYLWHLDFLHRFINKAPVYLLLLLDDFSRYIVGWDLWDAERADVVVSTFDQAVARHGRPEKAMSDRGSAFWAWKGTSRFTRVLEDYGVEHILATTPQSNGKLEVLNANVAKEVFDTERFFDLAETRRRLDVWVDFYNFRRTHQGLGGLLVPADRYFGRADRVLAALEAGRSGEGICEPMSVAARALDLLRVTSRAGQVEVLLMGQRIWPAGS